MKRTLKRSTKIAIVLSTSVLAFVAAVLSEKADSAQMEASYYSEELRGSPTASGELFNPDALTAAHKTLPLGTRLLVKHEGKGVAVTVTDRGPYVGGRDLDLSRAAADTIGLTEKGTGEVQVEQVSSPTPDAEPPQLPKTGGPRD